MTRSSLLRPDGNGAPTLRFGKGHSIRALRARCGFSYAWQLGRDVLLAELASFGALMDVTTPCVNSFVCELDDSK